jgi:hypothetical protein
MPAIHSAFLCNPVEATKHRLVHLKYIFIVQRDPYLAAVVYQGYQSQSPQFTVVRSITPRGRGGGGEKEGDLKRQCHEMANQWKGLSN